MHLDTAKLLLTRSQEEFDENVRPYYRFMCRHVKELLTFSTVSVVGGPLVYKYARTLNTPIRKLEYSFVIENSLSILSADVRVLDAGCGITPLVKVFADQGARVFGIDLGSTEISLCNRKDSPLYDPRVIYSRQSMTRLAFKNETFDVITCVSVLEHMQRGQDTFAMRELLRCLRRDGKLIVTVDFEPLEGMTAYLVKHIRRLAANLQSKGLHFNSLKPDLGSYDLRDILRYLLKPFVNRDLKKPLSVNIKRENIKRFWERHGYKDDYYQNISFGFIIKK